MKTTKTKIQEIRDATKVILLPYSAPDFARDAAIKYMEALNPKMVTSILDDLETLQYKCARQAELLERAKAMIFSPALMKDGAYPWLSDYERLKEEN